MIHSNSSPSLPFSLSFLLPQTGDSKQDLEGRGPSAKHWLFGQRCVYRTEELHQVPLRLRVQIRSGGRGSGADRCRPRGSNIQKGKEREIRGRAAAGRRPATTQRTLARLVIT